MGAGDGHMGSTWEQVMGTWEAHASRSWAHGKHMGADEGHMAYKP